MKTLLALDVDGPLNPDWPPGRDPSPGFVTYRWKSRTPRANGSIRYQHLPRVWLNPAHGAALKALDAELVWGTSWNLLANQFISPALGLPDMPTIRVGEPAWTQRPDGLHWKVPALAKFRPGQPMLWVDDECTQTDAKALTALRDAPTSVFRVDPRIGLTECDFHNIAILLRGTCAPDK